MERFDTQALTGLILAGGRGSRMGGVDKGLQKFQGIPLTLHALMRLQGQCTEVLINANRNLGAYESFGVPVWPDSLNDFAGPLAGFLVGLEHCQTPYLMTVPCDSPRFPLDLGERLGQALLAQEADIAMAVGAETNDTGSTLWRTQPVFCLLRTSLLESLVKYSHGGGRKIDAWTAQHRTVSVPFDQPDDDPLAFANVNTLADLHALEDRA
ncbi:MAG: molybdenum cofactor guanylyltransferase MobA [Alphaproteobacteria bacterium]|nr:molybdenum cofactor guanylyltransferase MobA [Alphaproteobacteria bacterium]